MKRIIDAYQKIAAPEGLKERIEAAVQARTETGSVREMRRWFSGWMPKVALGAAAAVCVAVLAVGISVGDRPGGPGSSGNYTDGLPGIRLAMEDGDVLGDYPVTADFVTACDLAQKNMSWTEADDRAMIFQVTAQSPVTFSADSECLSLYEQEKDQWTNCRSELVINSSGAFCVLLPVMGDDEVFYIQMSSAGDTCWLAIVYEQDGEEYKAALRKNNR